MIFDTHCHYNLEPLFQNWQSAWQSAQDNGVTRSAVIGTSVGTSLRALTIAQADRRLVPVIGIHPSEWQELVEQHPTWTEDKLMAAMTTELEDLTRLGNKYRVWGIGETGLDYFRLPDDPTHIELIKKMQIAAFIWQLELAKQHQVPVIIHVRDTTEAAYWDTLSLLKTHYQASQPFILHCISGPLAYVQQALDLGGYIGMAGNSTYKNADHIRHLIRTTPADRLLLETDAPYLPPQAHRGEVCQPQMIRQTAEYLADELGLDLAQTYQNSLTIFG